MHRSVFVIISLCLACATTGDATSAHTLGKGKSRIGLTADEGIAFGYARGPTPNLLLPHLSVTWEQGVWDALDVGVRLGNGTITSQVKLRLYDGGVDRPTISIAPWVTFYWQWLFSGTNVAAPVLMSWNAEPDIEVIGSLSVNYSRAAGGGLDGGGYDENLVYPGIGVGLLFHPDPGVSIGPHLELVGPAVLERDAYGKRFRAPALGAFRNAMGVLATLVVGFDR